MTAPKLRVLFITPAYTLMAGQGIKGASARPTPEDCWAQGFGQLLNRVSSQMTEGGVILLDQAAAEAFGLPTDLDQIKKGHATGGGFGGCIQCGHRSAIDAGWKVEKPGPWTTFHANGRPTIHVAVSTLLTPDRCPLVNPVWQLDTAESLALWHEWSGHPWQGTPGVAGTVLLRTLTPKVTVRGRQTPPTFKPATIGPEGASERVYDRSTAWKRPHDTRNTVGFDCRRMYLNAAGQCETLAPWTLRHTGAREFDPKLAGWWLVELGPWQDDRIPAPAGPGESRRWVTTPTLALLHELAEAGGPYQSFEVLDSWTGEGKRLLRRWAGTLEKVYQSATETCREVDKDGEATARAQDATRVRKAVKEVYRETWGLLNRSTNSVYRPDWHFTVLAQARANMWRRMWQIGQTEDRWPVEMSLTDTVWYEGDKPDGLEIGDRLGQFGEKKRSGK